MISYLSSKGHLSEECLTLLICDELPFFKKFFAQRHLSTCWRCRARYERLEKTALAVVAYRDEHFRPHIPRFEKRRERFVKELRPLLAQKPPRAGWAARLGAIPRLSLPSMNLTLTASLCFAFASIVCAFLWFQQRIPNISSNALLVKAEVWDAPQSTGVVYQKVRITTPDDRVERTIYRDLEGKRKPRLEKVAVHEAQLRQRLEQVGLDWNEPLSATAYQDWHDRQRVREDHLSRAGRHLIRLTTSVPTGEIAEQSLTVRDTDFHPVERTVAFRGSDAVEIAEVEYRVLPWDAVDASTFEPLSVATATALGGQPPILHLVLPPVPTPGQLDESELSTRVLLNRLHADTDEQIELNRHDDEIEVKGVVETGQRKRELQAQLRMIPHVFPSILSFDDLKKHDTGDGVEGSKLSMATVASKPSPLELFLQVQGHGTDTLSSMSQQLLNNALIVERESKAITALQERFATGTQMPDLAAASWTTLMFSHRERILAAVQHEQEQLAKLGVAASAFGSASGDRAALGQAAADNLTLCKELTSGSDTPRDAQTILHDLADRSAVLREQALHVPTTPPTNAPREDK